MTKLEFKDNLGNYGYIKYTEDGLSWKYEGEYDIVYEHMFSQTDMEGHGRLEEVSDNVESDTIIEFRPEEKISNIVNRFHYEPKITTMAVDGEVV